MAADEPTVTVVVPAHGPAASVDAVLRSLVVPVGSGSVPVVVSDDASDPPLTATLDLTAYPGLSVVVVRDERNGGPGAARNRALEYVATPWVAFLDADMEAGPGWLARVLAITAAADADVVGFEGRVELTEEVRPTPFSHTTEFADPGSHHGAGNVVLRRDALAAVGGYDERFFDPERHLHFREDTDLYFRLVDAGCRIDYDDDLVAHHPPLPPAWSVPVRLARRYYFDPLLAKKHQAAFTAMNRRRMAGPVSLRAARHYAASAYGIGVLAALAGTATGRPGLRRVGRAAALGGWLGSLAALCWRRRVAAREVVPLLGVSAVVPAVYLANYWRGVVAFRYRPRLR